MTRGRRRGRIVVAAGASLLLAAVACTSEGPSAEPPAITSPSPDSDSPASTADTTDAPTTSAPPLAKPLTIAVAGDIHFEGVLRGRLDEPATALSPATEVLAAADVAIVNLETSIGTGGRPAPDKRYTFQAPPSAFTALAEAGIDAATMANNHALDFGRAPLPGMFDAIDAAETADPALTVIGIGQDADQAFQAGPNRDRNNDRRHHRRNCRWQGPDCRPHRSLGIHQRHRRYRRRDRPDSPHRSGRGGRPHGRRGRRLHALGCAGRAVPEPTAAVAGQGPRRGRRRHRRRESHPYPARRRAARRRLRRVRSRGTTSGTRRPRALPAH